MTSAAKRDKLNPLITPRGRALIRAMEQHPDAPRFNYAAGDQIDADDLERLARFRESLAAPAGDLMGRVARWLDTVPLFRRYGASDPVRDWQEIPTTSREDLARHPELLVPDDEPLDRMIIYRTSGTTGHPLMVPHHPRSAASYQIMIEHALASRGIAFEPADDRVACFLLGAQRRTVTYPTVLAAWRGAGFAKLNLSEHDWPTPDSPARYVDAHAPQLLNGDPLTFARLLERAPKHRPNALLSTAVAMSPALKRSLEEAFAAPVLEWYSLTETGPIGCTVPGEEGYFLLAPDVLVETLTEDGRRAPPGERGEITVTGGRNPYVPLLRYRTGDWGRLVGDRILDLEGRSPVMLRTAGGRRVSPQDLAAVLRDHPVLQYELRQRRDRTCEVTVRPLPVAGRFDAEALRAELEACLDGDTRVAVKVDATLGDASPGGKVHAFASEVPLDE